MTPHNSNLCKLSVQLSYFMTSTTKVDTMEEFVKMLQEQKINIFEDGIEMSLSFLPLELQQKFPFLLHNRRDNPYRGSTHKRKNLYFKRRILSFQRKPHF